MVLDIEYASRKELETTYADAKSCSRVYFIVTAIFTLAALLCLWALTEVDSQKDVPIGALIKLVPNGNHMLAIMIFSTLVALLFLLLSLDIRQSSRIIKLAMIMRFKKGKAKKVK